MLILPETRIVEAHDLLLGTIAVASNDDGPEQVDALPFRFTLADLRRRGRYLSALQAPTYDRAAAWIGSNLLPSLPFAPDEAPEGVAGADIWRELARSSGDWAEGVQKRSRMKQVAFNRLVAMGEQQDLLHRLPEWREPGSSEARGHKLYLNDPGVMHRLLGWDERLYVGGPLGVGPARMEAFWRLRDKSWEAFVVTNLIRAAGLRARATVWEGNPGEIDLILDWDRETWAIEVTRGRSKKFREMHGAGHRITNAARPIILVYDDEVGLPELRGAGRLGHKVECMSLVQALREVRAGP